MNKAVKTTELFDCKTPYLKALFNQSDVPWDILPEIKAYVKGLLEEVPDGFSLYDDGILVGEDVVIHPLATVLPPAVIGKGTELRPGAFLRGNVITGEHCVIGNSSELKNCVLLDRVQVPHYNYVGDSILGNGTHMGAGSICSNLKSNGKTVVIHGEKEMETGLRKLGAILADGADIGCGCVLNPGTVVGKNTTVYPLTCLRGVYPAEAIVKTQTNVVNRK